MFGILLNRVFNIMRYILQTTNWSERRDISQLCEQIPNLEMVVDDGYRNARQTFLRSLALTDEPCVRIEDDIELCDNFTERIESIIQEKPNDVINFFINYPEERFRFKSGLIEVPGRKFMFNQCTYYPQGIASQILKYSEEDDTFDYDVLMAHFFDKNNINFYQYLPNIVNHKCCLSLIDKKRPILGRTDLTFKRKWKKKI